MIITGLECPKAFEEHRMVVSVENYISQNVHFVHEESLLKCARTYTGTSEGTNLWLIRVEPWCMFWWTPVTKLVDSSDQPGGLQ
jgi:hypothetical protein